VRVRVRVCVLHIKTQVERCTRERTLMQEAKHHLRVARNPILKKKFVLCGVDFQTTPVFRGWFKNFVHSCFVDGCIRMCLCVCMCARAVGGCLFVCMFTQSKSRTL